MSDPDPKHILVVDDNDEVRQVIVEFLIEVGYRASAANGGEEMRAFVDVADPIDLIVLDATMPGEQGVSLALHAKERGIRVLMISGSVEQMEDAHATGSQLLEKPFRMADLQRAVERALASDTFGRRPADPE